MFIFGVIEKKKQKQKYTVCYMVIRTMGINRVRWLAKKCWEDFK